MFRHYFLFIPDNKRNRKYLIKDIFCFFYYFDRKILFFNQAKSSCLRSRLALATFIFIGSPRLYVRLLRRPRRQ